MKTALLRGGWLLSETERITSFLCAKFGVSKEADDGSS